MADKRCVLTELPVAMCAHCRKMSDIETDPRTPGPPFAAAYPGRCVDCHTPFDAGDRIRADGQGGWLGPCCIEEN